MHMDDETPATTVDAAAWSEAIRQRALTELERPPPPRYWRWYAAALILPLLLHLGLLIELREAMQTPARDDESVVQVILLNPELPPPMPVAPPLLTRANTPARIGTSIAASSDFAPAAPALTPDQASTMPRIFNQDGSIRLPPAASAVTPREAGLARGRKLLARGHNMIHCRRSKFDNGPTPEEAGNQAGRGARMAQLIMGNPLDPLANVGAAQEVDTARELAAAKRAIEEQACDY
jgi:hypothetical protein